MYLRRTFTEEAFRLRNIRHDTQIEARVICYCAVGCRSRIKTRDPKRAGRLHRLIVSPVIPGVTTILFCRIKKDKYAF